MTLCLNHPRNLLDELRAHTVIAEVHLMHILVQSFNEFSTALIINSIISEIHFPNCFRYFQSFCESRYIIIAHTIVFKVDLIFMTLELDKTVWYRYQVVLAAILQERGRWLLLVLASLNTP